MEHLAQSWPDLKNYELFLTVTFWILLIALYVVLDSFIRRGWKGRNRLRRRWCPQARFEDFWLQNVGNERPFSLSLIFFDPERSCWVYWGRGFDAEFKPRSEWEALSIHYDPRSRDWFFAGEGSLLEERGGIYHKTKNTFEVVPILSLPFNHKDAQIEGRVADFNFVPDLPIQDGNRKKEDRVFPIVLIRGSQLLGRMPSMQDIKQIRPHQAELLFRKQREMVAYGQSAG